MNKISCFTANLTSGGAQHQLSILANFLSERGYEMTIITYNDEAPDHYPLNSDIRRIRLDLKGNALVKQFKACRFFMNHKTDCFISYRSTSNFILLLGLLFRRNRPKIIVSERNTTVKPTSFEFINYNFLYRFADSIVPNSNTQAKYLRSLNKSWINKVTCITNFTDPLSYKLSSLPRNISKVEIGVFSRLFPQKNYERFCITLFELKKKGYLNFHVTWYGDRQEGAYIIGSNHIKELIDNYSLSDVLEVKDAVKDVISLMPNFHMMCLPSLYEGFSNSISEYICCGKMVLCSNVSDNSVMVKDGLNGYLFDPYSVDSMVEAFEKALKLDRDSLIKMGCESRTIAEKLFSKEKFVGEYEKLINN